MKNTTEHKVYYDGDCKLCKRSVEIAASKDRDKKFVFTPLNTANHLTSDPSVKSGTSFPDSVVLEVNGKRYEKSTAVLRIMREMKFPWNIFYIFIIIPAFLRDPLYSFFARNRKLFFRSDDHTNSC